MDLKTLASLAAAGNFVSSTFNITSWADSLAHFNNTATNDAVALATTITALLGVIMTKQFGMTVARYFFALVVAMAAYFVSDVCLTRILSLVKIFLCTLAALLVFLSARSLIPEDIVT